MKASQIILGLIALPSSLAWGGFGHITVAYIASDFVLPHTKTYFQALLKNTTSDYLAGVATWADSIRYTKWGHFTGPFHFIDAKDKPPESCNVDFDRDCKAAGCVVSALANYTARLQDGSLPAWDHEQAAKFVIHFVGDIHQPLHDEDVSRGGNGIHVKFDGAELNLHHVWDTSIPEKIVGGVRGRPYDEARRWADQLTKDIRVGKFKTASHNWLVGVNLTDPKETTLGWAREGNAYVCSTVLPEGAAAIAGQELGAEYYTKAAPVVEIQIARAGYRLATWLDLIATKIVGAGSVLGDEL